MSASIENGIAARSKAAVVHEPGAGIAVDELQLATRNHVMPLEILRENLTPTGLHYVLIHFDIPHVDPAGWRLELDGALARPVTLDLADLTRRERHTVRVTMRCAGNWSGPVGPAAGEPAVAGEGRRDRRMDRYTGPVRRATPYQSRGRSSTPSAIR